MLFCAGYAAWRIFKERARDSFSCSFVLMAMKKLLEEIN